jgi:peptidase M28-like protein
MRAAGAVVALVVMPAAQAVQAAPAAHAGHAPGMKSDDPREATFAAAVDEKRLLQTVRDLVACGPRMGGTPSGEKAAKYHAERFRAAGLVPVTVKDPELRAFQPLEVSAVAEIDGEAVELKDGALALHTAGIEKTTLPLLAAEPAEDAAHEPFALLVDEGHWGQAAKVAHPRQPRVLLVSCACRLESSTPVLHQPSTFAGTLLTISAREAKAIRAKLAADAHATLTIEARVFDGPGAPLTVYADLPAKAKAATGAATAATASAPILLFCAHGDSDSGGPGADDNGSGDAVVQELAADFAKLAKEKGLELPFTLRFLVWGSEIHSSGAYVARATTDGSLARHVAVINFDEAGTGAERDCIYFEPDNVALTQPLVRVGLEMAGDYVDRKGFWTEYVSNAALGGTDAYLFEPGYQHGGAKGDVPAITIFTAAWGKTDTAPLTPGFKSPHWKGGDPIEVDYSRVYHETGDRPENTTELEPWDMVWVTKAAGLLTLRLANSPETIARLLAR